MLMDSTNQIRRETARRRQPPGRPVVLTASFESGCNPADSEHCAPTELTLEATNAEGDAADWFNDAWWGSAIRHWGNSAVTLHIAPTTNALLHPIVLHHLEMVSRVLPKWRIVGHAYRDDVTTDEAIDLLGQSAYHEVRFFDQPRRSKSPSDRIDMGAPLEQLFARIRREQSRINVNRPVLVRLPSNSSPGDANCAIPMEHNFQTT